jgi:preprotein translocase YajC subunit
MIQMLAIVAIIYFVLIRPKSQQEKKHRERLGKLRKGDEVVTVGGIVGRIVHIKETKTTGGRGEELIEAILTLESGKTRVEVLRDRVSEVRSGAPEGETK